MIFATLRLLVLLVFRSLGSLFFYCFKKRRTIALENVKRCYPFLFKTRLVDSYRVRNIVKKSFAMLGQTLADFLLLSWYTNKNIDRYIYCSNIDCISKEFTKGKGVILAAAHFGSWELAAHYAALKGFKSLILYNKFKKPLWLDTYIKLRRERSGNTLLLKQNSFITLYKHLKKGGIITLLMDQHAQPPEGIQVSLLGQKAWTHATFVKMSLKTGASIIPGFIFSKGWFSYVLEFGQAIKPQDFLSELNPVELMTRRCNEMLEKAILQAPDHWMWQHNRFKEVHRNQ